MHFAVFSLLNLGNWWKQFCFFLSTFFFLTEFTLGVSKRAPVWVSFFAIEMRKISSYTKLFKTLKHAVDFFITEVSLKPRWKKVYKQKFFQEFWRGLANDSLTWMIMMQQRIKLTIYFFFVIERSSNFERRIPSKKKNLSSKRRHIWIKTKPPHKASAKNWDGWRGRISEPNLWRFSLSKSDWKM